jgi:hypothetical protein
MAINGRIFFLGTLALTVGILGCGSPDDMMQMDGPPPPAHGFQLKTPDLTINAGQEKYLCYTVDLSEAADTVAITGFQAFVGPVVHHYEVFQTLIPEQSGVWDCTQQQIKMTWLPLFGGAVGATGLTLPDGEGFKIPGDTQLLVQIHMLNATQSDSTSSVVINMTYANDVTTITPAGIYALGTMDINLMPGATGVQLGSQCAAPKPMNVFGVQPHMHKLGTAITFQQGSDPANMQVIYQRNPWVFGAQPIDPFQINLKTGDYIGTTCTYNNTTTQTVTYGESTSNEMCYFILFYTPFDHLDACLG